LVLLCNLNLKNAFSLAASIAKLSLNIMCKVKPEEQDIYLT
jgi:hypothetical protein